MNRPPADGARVPPEEPDEDDEFDDVPTQLHRDIRVRRPLSPDVGVTVAGKYRLESLIAKGGMGTVWRALDELLERPVAVKFMDPSIAADDVLRERFAREAKAAARLRTPHVVQIYDYGIQDLLPYMVMELLEGEDLHARLKRQAPLALGEAGWMVSEIAKGLQSAHEAGVVHRDLKPQNVFLSRQGSETVVKILDFGVAKLRSAGFEGFRTEVGTVLGSPNYMSPEQARGRTEIDHRADLWSLAVITFRAVTGKMAFPGEIAGAVLIKICADPIPIPSRVRPGLPPWVDEFFARALQRDPNERFQTAAELAETFCRALLDNGAGPPVPLEAPYPATDSQRAAAMRPNAGDGSANTGSLGRGAHTPPPQSARVGTPRPTPRGGQAAMHGTPVPATAASGVVTSGGRTPAPTPHSPVSNVRAPEPMPAPAITELGEDRAEWPTLPPNQKRAPEAISPELASADVMGAHELPLLVGDPTTEDADAVALRDEMTLDTRQAMPGRRAVVEQEARPEEPLPSAGEQAAPAFPEPAAAPAALPSPGPGTDELPVELPVKRRGSLAAVGGVLAAVVVLGIVAAVILKGGPPPNPALDNISTTVPELTPTTETATTEPPSAVPTEAPTTPSTQPTAESPATSSAADDADAGAKSKKKKGPVKPKGGMDWGY